MSAPSTKFVRRTTDISGLLIFDVTRVEDDRGWFQEKYHREKLLDAGFPADFDVVQTSVAFNKEGSTRGLHAEPWDKYISIIDGEAYAAYVDLREGPGFGQMVTVTLRPDVAVFLPAGVANSYQCLSPLHYLYAVNKHWTPDAYDRYSFVNLADPDLAIDWPIPLSEALLSAKDQQHPFLRDAVPFKSEPS
ncbi:dTDP-4-dehydrorhamnose 3,5-epimerase [Curtobacterium sp. MCPF17_021]|uniref:dTDP-4-dehydrorhamnose 3,5-epimerase family protein n=1 Tax=Curtobacterium sp. MCPF17_021 TaxID=2175639 RepID=UPI000DAA6D63|nr:dTDP-4-dehydrorhamnose 3,5-epimerase [Curtobacterium sp. MCPF17_021]WIE83449.1 dTDP-4-dehydrorhamnose 3,5-epimerase [Curtobacterium sp. MCPF17_021]